MLKNIYLCERLKFHETMEEKNVNEVLGVSSDNEKKEVATKETKVNNSAEETLTTVAFTILVLGIITTVICFFSICFVETLKPGYEYVTEKKFNPAGFATTVMIFFTSLISWSIMKVLANISLTLKEMNQKMK